jgi:arginyl-tRNA synthetase
MSDGSASAGESATPPANLLDQLEATLGDDAMCGRAWQVPRNRSFGDLRLFGAPWPDGASHFANALDRLASHPAIAALRLQEGELRLNVADDWVAETATQLERGERRPLLTNDLLSGRSITVCFCDVNATKALHAGHLRNIALGVAVSGIATAAGATVVRRSNVNDMGRSMGEALAGYEMFGESPRLSWDEKGDHLIGECYSRYVEQMDDRPDSNLLDPTLQREAHQGDDRAEELLRLLADGEPPIMDRWRRVRDLVIDGHSATLARLGTTIDKPLFESDFVDTIDRVVSTGLNSGLFTKTDDGATVFRTGRDDYPQLLLARPDGFPTQHLRYVALWTETAPSLRGAISVEIMGDEWLALGVHGDRIMKALSPDIETHPSRCLLHGMVTAAEGVIKSSDGSPLLIDALLDALVAAPRVRELAARHGSDVEDRFAALLLLGYCLKQPPQAPLPFDLERVLDSRQNPTWDIAEAIARSPDADGLTSPDPGNPEFRALVLYSQLHRQFVAKAHAACDPTALYRHYRYLARWYVGARRTPELQRVGHTIFVAGASALGLWPSRVSCPVFRGDGDLTPV